MSLLVEDARRKNLCLLLLFFFIETQLELKHCKASFEKILLLGHAHMRASFDSQPKQRPVDTLTGSGW